MNIADSEVPWRTELMPSYTPLQIAICLQERGLFHPSAKKNTKYNPGDTDGLSIKLTLLKLSVSQTIFKKDQREAISVWKTQFLLEKKVLLNEIII